MAWIIFSVIVGLALRQFWMALTSHRDDLPFDVLWHFILGVIYSALAFVFGLGALLG